MTNKPKDKQAHRQTDFGMNTVRWLSLCVSLRLLNATADICNKKKEFEWSMPLSSLL